ncbi:InlB B-repeat-containing protein [Eggerthella lenta]|uniref:InlB B-repeat-containing protein n=1 Tax=Eggerthella lenta TaxID=84112 RepID=UPI000E43F235|nr:InlB B-repeat-containing protein [Eggerthella lenta]RGL75764.1 hypothetical protein DXC46_14120 [Eggerthella lenta]
MPTRTKKQGIRAAARAIAACSLALALALPGAALAADQPGSTALGIRVTDSARTVKMVLDPCDGSPATEVEVPYNTVPAAPAEPARDGYAFLGWFDAPEGGSRFAFDAPLTADLKLYAQWSLIVSFSVPTSVIVTVDASGAVSPSKPAAIESSTVRPLKVTGISGTELPGAARLIPDGAARSAARVAIASAGGASASVGFGGSLQEADLAGFAVPAKGNLPLAFGLSLSEGTVLNYHADDQAVVSMAYTVAAV